MTAVGDARKRLGATESAPGATNSPETGNRTPGPENGAERLSPRDVRALVADARAHGPHRPHPFCPSCVDGIEALAAELDRLTAALASERARVAAGLALAEEWEMQSRSLLTRMGFEGDELSENHHANLLRAALTTTGGAAPTTTEES